MRRGLGGALEIGAMTTITELVAHPAAHGDRPRGPRTPARARDPRLGVRGGGRRDLPHGRLRRHLPGRRLRRTTARPPGAHLGTRAHRRGAHRAPAR
nr:hypothetical protein [Spongiactinospora gelatinilytica]